MRGNDSSSVDLTSAELAEILRVAMHVGKLMLQSGAASFRTELTMQRVAQLMGVEQLDAYITPTGIIASAYTKHEHRTQILRVNRLGVNMNCILALEDLTRHTTGQITPQEVMTRIKSIEELRPIYPPVMIMLAVGAACGGLAVILGGGWIEALAATGAAFVAQGLRIRLAKQALNPLLITMLCAALATLVSLLVVRVLHAPQPQIGITASVLLLVPGVPLVTAIIDLTRLDLVSGISRGVHAFLLFASIAIGMVSILAIFGFNII